MKFAITSTLLSLMLTTQSSYADVEKMKHFSSFDDLSNVRVIDIDNDSNKDIIAMINDDSQRLYIISIIGNDETVNTPVTNAIEFESEGESIASFEIYYDKSSDNHFAIIISDQRNAHLVNLTARKYVKKIPNITADNVKFKDIDNDGNIEVMLINESTMYTLDMHSLETKAHYTLPHYEFTVGKFTNHLLNEMLTWDGEIYQIQGSDVKKVGELPVTSRYLFAKDLNNDGMDEAVGEKCTIDVNKNSVIWPLESTLEDCNQDNDFLKYTSRSPYYNNDLYQDYTAIDNNAEMYSDSNRRTHFNYFYNYLTREEEVIGRSVTTQDGGDYQPNILHYIYEYLDLYGDEQKETIEQIQRLNVKEVRFGEVTELGFNGNAYLAMQNEEVKIIEEYRQLIIIAGSKRDPAYLTSYTILNSISPVTQTESWSKSVTKELYASKVDKVSIIPFGRNTDNKIVYSTQGEQWNPGIRKHYILNMDGSNHIEQPFIGYFKLLGDIDGDGNQEYLYQYSDWYYADQSKPFEVRELYSDSIKYTISLIGEPQLDTSELLTTIDFDGDGIKELVFEHLGTNKQTVVYNFVKNTHSLLDLGDIQSLDTFTYNNNEQLYTTTQDGALVSISAQGNKQEVANFCASSKLIAVEQHLSGQLHIACENELGVFNLANAQYNKLVTLDVAATHSDIEIVNEKTYWLITHSNGRELFKIGEKTEQPYQLSVTEFNTNKFTPVEFKALSEKDSFNYRFYISKAPSKGNITFTDRALGHFSYTPTTGEVGLDQFELSMSIGGRATESVSVSVNIDGTPLVIEPNSISAHWRTPLSETLSLSGAGENSNLQLNVKVQPASGEFVFSNNATGEFTYTPLISTLEPANFVVNISNEIGLNIDKMITINHTNTSPQTQALELIINQSEAAQFELLAQDADSDPLTYELVSEPSIGSVTLDNNSGIASYTPQTNTSYETSFQYRVFDGMSYSEPSTVTITTKADDTDDKGEETKEKSGGSMPFYILSLLVIVGLLRKSKFSFTV